jgi:trehalose/maltose hydrolase-like predicted phosphorylase
MVMPPDEYACPVNNSGYTNTVASLALAAAVEFADVVGDTVPAEWAGMAKSIAAATAAVPTCTPPTATCPALTGEMLSRGACA